MTPRGGRVAVLALGALLVALRPVAGAGASLQPPPPLPPQPSATPAPTQCPPRPAGQWTVVTAQASTANPDSDWYQLYADPWRPCVVYRAADAQTIERSVDWGASWHPLFHDGAAAFTIS